MSESPESSTLPLQDDISELPEEDSTLAKDEAPAALISLIPLNAAFKPIALLGRKTILGRNPAKCSEGGLLNGSTISGTHCEISTRSVDDVDAPLWIKDISSNGVWVNEKKIIRDEATKIVHRDIISFAPGAVDGQADSPAYMLIDKRTKSAFKDQQKLQAKRVSEQLGIDLSAEEAEPDQKKQKLEVTSAESEVNNSISNSNNSNKGKDKEEEDNAFEKEFDSFDCPSCRQRVSRTKRDFRLNNLIGLFLKSRPHMARDDVTDGEDGGDESDSSNVVRRGHGDEEEEDDDGYDYSDDDDDDDDGDNGHGRNFNPLSINQQDVICPCCDPANTTGYVCPDGVRLGPLLPTATYAEYQARRHQPQPGHTRCRRCSSHVPLIPSTAPGNIADLFQCKLCLIPSCGCSIKSVEDNILEFAPIMGILNPAEERIINDYLAAERLTVRAVWENIKQGMADGTYHYLGTSVAPSAFALGYSTNPASASVDSGLASGVNGTPTGAQIASSDDNNNNDANDALTSSTAAGGPAPPISTRMTRAEGVTALDKLCHACSREFFSNGPLYQWRKNLDRSKLPSRVITRENCWYGRECRTQFNHANPSHAERLNHICEKRPPRS
ncbi:hypothetical protein BGZ70_009708 [Mortierella alpina]|uniref:FHA domain-containing protein n=1 Tax=Mortierella alpina TaxID=64518 RepID=A0A9P6J0M4_MORAP|nr:hypothetical protein BGZ70_009708 [Mortierella alpina]